MSHSYYLENVFDYVDMRKTVSSVARKIKILKNSIKIDAVAFTGNSGAGIAYPLFFKTGIPLICVRKDKENSHGKHVESTNFTKKHISYIILDDLICNGDTVRTIVRDIDSYYYGISDIKFECTGILLYLDAKSDYFPNINNKRIPVFSIKD